MDVNIPNDLDPIRADELKRVERERAQALQAEGTWRHLWRIAGQYSNISIFDVETVQELHDIVSTLPLFPFMDIAVTPLCRHPSSIRDDDR
jgi:muconolactone D-isomerase